MKQGSKVIETKMCQLGCICPRASSCDAPCHGTMRNLCHFAHGSCRERRVMVARMMRSSPGSVEDDQIRDRAKGGRGKRGGGEYTHRIANFRGTGHRIGNRAKQSTKHARAATLHAPKTSNRSQRLTKTGPSRCQCQCPRSYAQKVESVQNGGRKGKGMQERTAARSYAGEGMEARRTCRNSLCCLVQWAGRLVLDLHAKKPSSSSLRLGAGKGAPGASL